MGFDEYLRKLNLDSSAGALKKLDKKFAISLDPAFNDAKDAVPIEKRPSRDIDGTERRLFNEAAENYKDGLYEKALEKFDYVLMLIRLHGGPRGSLDVTLYGKGRTLSELNRYEDAIACYEEAMQPRRLKSWYAEAWFFEGVAFYELNRYKDAIECYDKVIEFKPPYLGEVWYNKGITFFELGEHEKAITSFDEAIKLDPSDLDSRQLKAQILRALGLNPSFYFHSPFFF